MTLKVILLAILTTCVTGILFGQTVSDFEKSYSSEKYFIVRPRVAMRADFDKEGQVCSVTLVPNRITKAEKTSYYLGSYYLDPLDIKDILNELVPPDKREGKGTSLGFWMTGSQGFGGYKWDNVQINTKVSFVRDSFRQSTIYPEPADVKPDDLNFLFDTMGAFPEIVIFTWTKRQCQ